MSLLSGVRVLAIEQYGAGPFGTAHLAALGAEVIKIEQPGPQGGDVARTVGPHFDASLPPTAESLFFQSFNRGKKSLTLRLDLPEGQAVFRRLVATADAVASNLRGDVASRLGLTHAQLRDVNPRIVCAHLSAYGRDGERASWPGYDYQVQAELGYFALTGEPDAPPTRMGLSLVDFMTGTVLALGLVSGVMDARASGEGSDVDVSLYDVALYNLNYLASWYLNAGAETTRQPRSAHPSLVPCQLCRTADGWIYLMCNKEKFWRALCELVGREEWLPDPRFVDYPARLRHRDELTGLLDDALAHDTTAGWMRRFGSRVPAAPVHGLAGALDAGFTRENGRIERVPTPAGGELLALRNPLRSSKHSPPLGLSPALGEHTAGILASVGIDASEQASLRARGVI